MTPILLVVLILTMVGVGGASAYNVADDGEPVHEYIVGQAYELFGDYHGLGHRDAVEGGAGHEDLCDHVYDRSGACVTYNHFWDVDKGIGDPVDSSIACADGNNAYEKALSYWAMALGEYIHGDVGKGYHYLGHTSHLLADMSVPAHVHEDIHYPDDDCFEDWMTLANAELSGSEKGELKSMGPVVIPDNVDPFYYLFYTTNQIGDFFPSDDYDGDTVDNYGGWMDQVYTDLGMHSIVKPRTQDHLSDNDNGDNNDDGDLGVIRHYSYKYAIRSTAALYKLYHDIVSEHRALTVVIDYVKAKDIHDEGLADPDNNADFFVEVNINGAWYRNEGDQIVNDDEIFPHWAFARDVGVTGSVPVVIILWDEDEAGTPGGDDDKSDLDPRGDGQDLDIWVNLDTGEITGDVSGWCGTPITVEGEDNDDDDESIMTFTVLLPNIPPKADAGADQTVNEGDTVFLTGTFTDPNTEDTHTYVWHLEQCSNGQVISDQSGPAYQSQEHIMGFIPCDNGLYYFSFTVTDNWGASGSDKVLITALNVPPVISDLHISSQPNSEFILPVVHEIGLEGTFTDAGTCDTHTAVWDWGGGKISLGAVTESGGSGKASGSHTYPLPGDYTVKLTVTDDDGSSDTESMTVHIADAGEALDIFNAYIQSLPESNFKNSPEQRKNAFNNMFASLDQMLADKNYKGMIQALNSNIRTKFDGLVGGSPRDDWIRQDLAIQKELCQKVDDITAYLKYLMSLSG